MEKRAREGVSPTAATTTERREETAGEAPPDSTANPGPRPGEGEGERLGVETRERRERLDEEDTLVSRHMALDAKGDAKGDATGDAKGDATGDATGDVKGDGDAAATERREPDAASPRGATRDRPDDEPAGVSASRTSKKPRLVWTPELHMRFMNAVNHLGIMHAVPKTILQLMNVDGMTRENVASHLQKYRLYLKRLAGLSPNAPMTADIMQRAQPYGAFPGNGAGMSVPFMPTMEQMHAGLPPTHPPGMSSPTAQPQAAQMALGPFVPSMGGMPTPFAPFGGAPPGPAHVALGVSDPYGAAAQQAYAAAGFGQFLNYMHGLQTSGFGALPAGAMPASGQGLGVSGAEVTSTGDNAWQAGRGGAPNATGADTKET